MIILLLICSLAAIGIAIDGVHKKARPILKEGGIELIFFIRFSDVQKFLNNEKVSEEKKDTIRKLLKRWTYLAISGALVFISTIIIARFFPSLAMI